jgi:branched-chain amino acid transport system ATP-binding protein
MMLAVEGLRAAYGSSQVLFDFSIDVAAGELVTLLGRNGMGKTTSIRAIMGLLPARGGSVRFEGAVITGRAPEAVARLGVGLVPEGRMVFPTLTVRENLVATAANRTGRSPGWTIDRVTNLFPRLRERAGQMGATLSGGEQQMLAIGRALMTNPKLLILDEATEGLAPLIRAEIWQCIRALREHGQSILIVDKNLAILKRLADRHVIIEKGVTVWRGTSAELDVDPGVVRRYLGV